MVRDPVPRERAPGWFGRSTWATAFVVVGVALAFGLLESMQGRLSYAHIPWHQYLPEALARALPSWMILAALAPVIAWLSRRIRVGRDTWRTALPLQFLAGLVFAVLHLGGMALFASYRHGGIPSATSFFISIVERYFVSDLFTYGAVVAALHAFDYQAEARTRQVLASELEAHLARARLDALRTQLHPHFLFNALNSIASMALNGERERVAWAVSRLSELLRRSLDESDRQEVPLAEELEVLDHYLALERVRFGDRLAIETRVPDDARSVLVASWMLQPIVENAIRHGAGAKRGPGRVVIEAAREGASLRLEVRDSGPGFPAGAPPNGNGIGLANTRTRLRHLYGDAHRMELGSAAEGGARVTIHLPWRTGAPGHLEGTTQEPREAGAS